MAQQPLEDSLGTFTQIHPDMSEDADFSPARWCKPGTISPSTWITGFSDNSETFYCAISGSQADLARDMEQHCCKGAVQESGDGCYHWCTPHAKKTDEWATCISDYVYTDTIRFGQSCNSIGDLERKNHLKNGLELRPGPSPSIGSAPPASWQPSVFLGLVAMILITYY